MKNIQHTILASVAIAACMMFSTAATAGNPDRAGSAGAGQLLINPWAQSNGMAGTNMAITAGLEGSFLNAAGLAFVNQTELRFANTQYLSGSGISLNTSAMSQNRCGELPADNPAARAEGGRLDVGVNNAVCVLGRRVSTTQTL
mgnify:CR=1 FL=1